MAITVELDNKGASMEEKARFRDQKVREYVLDGTPADVVARYERLVDLAETLDCGELDENVVIVDTETTGFSFNHDELIQIAAARMRKGKIVDWYITFVNPGKHIPDDVAHLTHIYDEDVKDAISPAQALEGLVLFAGNALMVAHNVGFDRTFVTRHPEGYPLLENIWIDSLDLSRIALPRLKGHRLIDLAKAFGSPTSTHRADDDVSATCDVFRILLAAVSLMPNDLVREIASMATIEEWPTVKIFQWFASQNGGGAVFPAKDNGVMGPGGSPGDAAGQHDSRPVFSLLATRRARVGALPHRAKKEDAEQVASDPLRALEFPTSREIDSAFSPEGIVGSIYEEYEPRPEQLQMAQAIRSAFDQSENLAVEAGTGVGKSMAYLVPAALTAQKNDITVGIATKTNGLLDQLVFQELPALARALTSSSPQKPPLTWASLKGMAHYPCLRKINRLVESGPGKRVVAGSEMSQAPVLAALLSYIEQTEFDDLDSLKIDYRALPKPLITTKSTECLRRKCPFYGTLCFVHGARKRAESADIVVTNHSLLFCDLAADGGLLPPIRHWIVDEAHGAEDEARKAFAQAIESEALASLVQRVSDAGGSRNVFGRAERKMADQPEEQITLFFGLCSKARAAGNLFAELAEDFSTHIKDLLYFDPAGRKSGYENVELWVNDEVRQSGVFAGLAEKERSLVEVTDRLITAASELVGYLESFEGAAEAQREIAATVMELKELRQAAELYFETASESYVYQASLVKKKDRKTDKLQASLVSVGDKLNETLYAQTHSVVYASATLAVNGRFDSFEEAVGLNGGEFSAARSLLLDSSYDFDNNMVVYVVSDMPEPGSRSYLDALNALLVDVHRAQQGSMLTLFTNRREMEQCYEVVQPQLKADDLRLICQKWGVSVKGLRDDFLADEHLSLFALKTFWQGFDAPGATLKGVVIPKLPFARPTDPLYCERASRDDGAWRKYVLPQAVIETKQAAGRLIRKADDHGVLILADKRLVTKSYGKVFLRSLQSKTVRVCTKTQIVDALSLMGNC